MSKYVPCKVGCEISKSIDLQYELKKRELRQKQYEFESLQLAAESLEVLHEFEQLPEQHS